MNIETSNVKKTKEPSMQITKTNNNDSSTKFVDELKEVAKKDNIKQEKENKAEEKSTDSTNNQEKIIEDKANIDILDTKKEVALTNKDSNNTKELKTNQLEKINVINKSEKTKENSIQQNFIINNPVDLEENNTQKNSFNNKDMDLKNINPAIENLIQAEIKTDDFKTLNQNFTQENDHEKINIQNNGFENKEFIINKTNKPKLEPIKEEIVVKNNENNDELNSALENMKNILNEFNQLDDKKNVLVKEEEELTDKRDMINNDFNIQEKKDLTPQMNLNMNFSGDGQPFSSFMNNKEEMNNKNTPQINSTEQDLAEEAAILSTMAENIAIANKNQVVSTQAKPKKSVETPTLAENTIEILQKEDVNTEKVKIITNEEGIKKVDTETGIKIETIVKYDTVIMNQADVEVFANLVEKGEINLNEITSKSVGKSVQVSKTLADMLAKSMENNQPLRINFDNDISVIIRISRDGKITADFLPSSQVAEAYLKENLPILRQKFDDSNIDYESLNQRERREHNKENNKKKGRNNE